MNRRILFAAGLAAVAGLVGNGPVRRTADGGRAGAGGRVVAAVDSGQPINPDGIRNQIEGAVVQSANRTLCEQVRFDRRRVTSRDWSGYPVLLFLGTGEAGQGPAAAAIANALHDAAGVRLRDLPLSQARVKDAIGV